MFEALIALALGAAVVAAAATGVMFQPGEWYRGLAKPRWTPPNILFPIAWTLLYAMMAIAAFRVAAGLAGGDLPEGAAPFAMAGLCLWATQITLNAMWSPIFFGARRGKAALICICALWTAILGTLICFAGADAVAAALLVPYLVWATYAGALNAAIVRMNPPAAFRAPAD
ncbi:tryptophan-rich sensory protein [Albimonas sp. CAU 1670]|uniref:TspO/MBR family protein n=1 Tax=Albimonas sp. CAU 1670 TaxID=3032599 RepID=UPI0023DB2501|nr:TspO/MBR family protein [Albimonas sp. CAU 1670]MDF2234461.1 tryptophan-rich sensory protein [Albimonas sp. CAU 1670]